MSLSVRYFSLSYRVPVNSPAGQDATSEKLVQSLATRSKVRKAT